MLDFDLKNSIFLTSYQEVRQICAPLFQFLNITHFDWIRTYVDGTRARLSTQPEWVEHYFNQQYFKDSQLERYPSLYQSGFSVWDYALGVGGSPVHNILKDMRENFNRDHGLSILKVYDGYMDNFIFTSTRENGEINEVYLRNLIPLEKFTIYFINAAAKLILEAEKNKIKIPLTSEEFYSSDNSALMNSTKLSQFYEAIKVENVAVRVEDKIIALSKQETKCLFYLRQGKRAKEIATILNLSPRTIEYYISNIKTKINRFNIDDIIPDVFFPNLLK